MEDELSQIGVNSTDWNTVTPLKAHHKVLNNAVFDGVWWWTETPLFWVPDSTCR